MNLVFYHKYFPISLEEFNVVYKSSSLQLKKFIIALRSLLVIDLVYNQSVV